MKTGRMQPEPKKSSIDPKVKAWIDNVIVPALIDRWEARPSSGVAA